MAEAVRETVGRKRWTRLIPVAIIVYIISFMDRTNIGFALNGLQKDLGIDAAQQGLAAGIFFIGYLTLQIPGGHLAERWSAKKFVGIMVLVWGLLAVATGFVQNFAELLAVRFLLGVAEAGIWPAILVLISHWFPAAERARAYAFWMMNIAISSIITAPLSGWIISFSDWRWLFIIEGLFPFVIAAPIWWIFISDRPRDAKWVTPEERAYIEQALAADEASTPHREHVGIRHVFSNGAVWRLTLVYFLIQIGFYGLNIWLPKVVKTITSGSSLEVGFVTAIPYVLAMFALWYNAKAADRSGRYSTHVLLSMAVGAVALVISVATGSSIPFLAVVFISIAVAGALAYDGPFWAAASRAMPVVVAGSAMGLINAVGNLGGFVGPYVGGFLQDASGGSFLAASVFLAICLLAAGLVMLTLRRSGDRPVAKASADAEGRRGRSSRLRHGH
ncbi:MFS transporter [Sinomonas terrae]|uniref:MFS transporter n=1 Tax=Sinomonas terrae TaxID=2908838 RepID=A0ABS9U0B2_9MICC|nr:MFS transporter [Sinomonas terrae]MCH6470090.1 MFS transporter [Sinomonas terrae]